MYSGDDYYGDDITSPLARPALSPLERARAEFYLRHADTVGWGWESVVAYLGHAAPYPRSAEEWKALSAEVRARRAA